MSYRNHGKSQYKILSVKCYSHNFADGATAMEKGVNSYFESGWTLAGSLQVFQNDAAVYFLQPMQCEGGTLPRYARPSHAQYISERMARFEAQGPARKKVAHLIAPLNLDARVHNSLVRYLPDATDEIPDDLAAFAAAIAQGDICLREVGYIGKKSEAKILDALQEHCRRAA